MSLTLPFARRLRLEREVEVRAIVVMSGAKVLEVK
jgi:hypothetical protein